MALSYPNYTQYGERYIQRFDDMHHKITNGLDRIAHNADMRSLKYGYGLDGIRNAVRTLKNSTQDIYTQKIRKSFHDQVKSFSKKLDEDKGEIWDESQSQQFYPEGFWHDAMNSEGNEHTFPDGSLVPAKTPEWAANAGKATGQSAQEVMLKLGHFSNKKKPEAAAKVTGNVPSPPAPPAADALLETQATVTAQEDQHGSQDGSLKAEDVPVIPYTHARAYAKAVEESSKRIGDALDLMTSKLPDVQKKSQEYKHNNFLLQQRVEHLGADVLPKFFKKVHEEKKGEVKDINSLHLQEIFTPRHHQVLKEAKQNNHLTHDMDLIDLWKRDAPSTLEEVEGLKFKEKSEALEKVNFGKNPYDSMANTQNYTGEATPLANESQDEDRVNPAFADRVT